MKPSEAAMRGLLPAILVSFNGPALRHELGVDAGNPELVRKMEQVVVSLLVDVLEFCIEPETWPVLDEYGKRKKLPSWQGGTVPTQKLLKDLVLKLSAGALEKKGPK